MKDPSLILRPVQWFRANRVELALCLAIYALAFTYYMFPQLRESLKNVFFVPVAMSALLLGWKKASAFTVLAISLVFFATNQVWYGNSTLEFLQLLIWGCTMAATTALIELIVLTRDKQVSQLLERQQSLAMTDQLTQVANRRAFDSSLRRKVSENDRHPGRLSVMMIDIDFFKNFNDRYGHIVGDLVLQTIARTIGDTLRDADLVARFGGEEFAVLLPNTPAEEAFLVAERIRLAVGQVDNSDVNCPEKLSVSIGVTDVEKGDNQVTILERADVALYEAKRNGRNQVVLRRSSESVAEDNVNNGSYANDKVRAVFQEGQSIQQIVDPVTGLMYFRVFDNELTRRMYESTRYGVNVCLGMIQLKRVDTRNGDKSEIRAQVAHIGRTIDQSLRASDLVTWYAEYEFAVLLPYTALKEGQKVLTRLKVKLNNDPALSGNSLNLSIHNLRIVELGNYETKGQAVGSLRSSVPLDTEATITVS